MDSATFRAFWIGTCAAAGLGVVIAILSTVGMLPRWSLISLGILGGLSFSFTAIGLNWVSLQHANLKSILILICIWAVMGVFCFLSWPPLKVDRPHINAYLVIDSINSRGSALFHFDLENISGISVKVSEISFTTPDEMNTQLQEQPMDRLIPPNGGKLRLSTGPLSVLKPENQNVDLDVSYNNLSEKSFSSAFRFGIQPKDVRPQTLSPDYLGEVDGMVVSTSLRILSGAQGTVFLVLDEKIANGKPNMVRFHDTRKDFLFDPTSRGVLWKIKTESGHIINISQNLPEKVNGRHLIVLVWDYSKGGILRVDGIEKEDISSH